MDPTGPAHSFSIYGAYINYISVYLPLTSTENFHVCLLWSVLDYANGRNRTTIKFNSLTWYFVGGEFFCFLLCRPSF